jgi:transcriptional regulator with XRE-family HTH domain
VESLGDKLKTAREERGLSFDYVSQETNISTRFLQALEREDFSPFPGETYIRGFIKSYGEFLDLDTKELQSLYSSIKIIEQPVPVEQLLRDPSPLPKIIKVTAASLGIIAIIAGIVYFIYSFPRGAEGFPSAARTVSEYTLNTDFLERRFYPGDSILVTQGNNTHRLVFTSLGDAITITTPRGPVVLDLGQEVAIDLNNDGMMGLRIIAADFVRNDTISGALLRFEQDSPPQALAALAAPSEAMSAGREAPQLILAAPNPFPFTLQAVFQGYCLFRYEILFERDRPGRSEQYYQRTQELSIQAQNGIRLGISNAQAVRLQVIGGGRTIPIEVGGPGEVVAADLRWTRDEENRFRLMLIRLD